MRRFTLLSLLAAPVFAVGCEALIDNDRPGEIIVIELTPGQGVPYWVQ